ncbi:MAG: ribosome recycling factor [Candidatus Eiseniibacteriota bacterium]
MPREKLLAETEERMKKTLENTRKELASIRTGRATTALLDTVHVNYYGNTTPLSQVASVNAPEPRLLIVQPWDKSLVSEISKAIQKADLGLNPTDDGAIIRVPIPSLTEERRKDLVKLVGKLAEEGRVHVRQLRREANEDLKKRLKNHDIPEDDEKRAEQDIQKLTDRYIGTIDEMLHKKTAEILEV